MPIAYLSRRAVFCSAHRLHSPLLSEDENRKIFGKCNNPKGHGHNYEIELIVRMAIDPRTGMAMNLVDLKNILEERFVNLLDHKHLDEDVEWFKTLPSTAENIAVVAWQQLAPYLPKGAIHEVRIRETENNVVTYRGE